MNVIFILDVSESMGYGEPPKIEQAFSAISSIVDELDANDKVAIVTFEVVSEKVLPFTAVKDFQLDKVKENIVVRGTTCLSIGLKDGLNEVQDGDTVVLLTDARPNLSLDRSGGFEGSIRLEEEALEIISSIDKKFNFYSIAIGEDAFIYTLKKMAEKVNGVYSLIEDFRGLKENPKKNLVKTSHKLRVSSIPAELPTAQPTWTKESQVLHVAVVSEEIFQKYKDSKKAVVVNPLNNREARVALIPISDDLLKDYRRRKSKVADMVSRGQRILLDKTYRDYLGIKGKETSVKLIILE